MREKDRLNAVGALITEKRTKKKERRKAKIKAKVKLRVEKALFKFNDSLNIVQSRLRILKEEMNTFNLRFTPLQPHTKTKWIDEIAGIEIVIGDINPKKE